MNRRARVRRRFLVEVVVAALFFVLYLGGDERSVLLFSMGAGFAILAVLELLDLRRLSRRDEEKG